MRCLRIALFHPSGIFVFASTNIFRTVSSLQGGRSPSVTACRCAQLPYIIIGYCYPATQPLCFYTSNPSKGDTRAPILSDIRFGAAWIFEHWYGVFSATRSSGPCYFPGCVNCASILLKGDNAKKAFSQIFGRVSPLSRLNEENCAHLITVFRRIGNRIPTMEEEGERKSANPINYVNRVVSRNEIDSGRTVSLYRRSDLPTVYSVRESRFSWVCMFSAHSKNRDIV